MSTTKILSKDDVASVRLRRLFDRNFISQYAKKDISKCLKNLSYMSEDEFEDIRKRQVSEKYPADRATMMWYLSAPSKNDDPPIIGPDGKPAWTKATVLSYMDDMSGENPVSLSMGDAITTHAGWLSVIGLKAYATEQLLGMAKTAASAIGIGWMPATAVAVGVIGLWIKNKDIKEIRETYKSFKGFLSGGDGHISDNRRKLYPWKESASDHLLTAFDALSPKPLSWKKIVVSERVSSSNMGLRMSRCQLSQQAAALLETDPSKSEAIVDRAEKKPFTTQFLKIVKKSEAWSVDQLWRMSVLITGNNPSVEFANVSNPTQQQVTLPEIPVSFSSSLQARRLNMSKESLKTSNGSLPIRIPGRP